MSTTEPKMEGNFWEQLTDALGSFSEGVVGFIGRIFGSSNERYVRELGYVRVRPNDEGVTHLVTPGSILARVNELEEHMHGLSDEQLKALTPVFRERLENGEALEDLMPEAFAACREAALRTKNMRHFDVQILGGVVLHRGNIAEMVTGEGKTLVATLPAYLNALEQQGVHIVTVNDYLARRDCEWMSPIYHALGITAGFIQSEMDAPARRKAYDCDITYGTNSEFGFDYLRDNMKPARWADPEYDPYFHQCQKALNFAIIDEVDNILVDEARTPLIISGPAFSDVRRYGKANEIAVQLTELQKKEPGKYYEIKEKEHTCHLTDEGIRKAEELAGVESFYTAGNMTWPHLIDNAMKAHHLYKKDKNYVVMRHPETNDMSIIIVDEFTGRLMLGRQWSDGLHQAVEAKHAREGVKIKEETQTLATITLQNYFKLYNKLAGMTGTAMTEANEFWKIYKLEVIAIPTNKPLIRINYPDTIYLKEQQKWDAVVGEIERVHKWDVVTQNDGTELFGSIKNETEETFDFVPREGGTKQTFKWDDVDEVERKGRPMLIGTTDVDKSEKLSAMLKRRGIKHELLNAKPEYAAREAEIVAQAGRLGAVTIATNMAGRGTDIVLGGNPETLAWSKLKDKYPTRLDVPEGEWKELVAQIEAEENMKEMGRSIAEMGGLHIIGTERHEARRIDNQLRGRAGRQGDPGSSRFYLSLQDDLMRIFAGEWVANVLQRFGMEEDQAIESRMVSRRIEAAQKKVEERNFDIRKNLLEYDEVMDHQRKRLYGYRQEILEGANCKLRIIDMMDEQISGAVQKFLDANYGMDCFAEFASKRLGMEFSPGIFYRCNFPEAVQVAKERATNAVPTQIHEMMEENLSTDVEQKEWNWQAMASQANNRWGLKLTDRELKKVGRDNVAQFLIEQAEKSIAEVDLSGGQSFLNPAWGVQSIVDWVRNKFGIKLDPAQLQDKEADEILGTVHGQVLDVYRQREIEFPVKVAMARYMSDRGHSGPAGQRYDREGMFHWCQARFPEAGLTEEFFRTEPRAKIQEKLLQISRDAYPKATQEEINDRLTESFRGTTHAEEADAQELAEWMKAELKLEVPVEDLTGVEEDEARQILWDAFDRRYRPEMRRVERSLLLNQLDTSWKNHLYTMDHLRQGIGLMGYAQEDPKTAYKREGMREFDAMWENLHDKVTDTILRMEEEEGFQESLWSIGSAVHEEAQSAIAKGAEDNIVAQQNAAIANSQKGEKKQEPIRKNPKEKVGRNDPCPCGSGKKYKNCHMRQAVG
jgi:preprotein translocase subunit SecA